MKLAKDAGTMGAAVFISRILGLVREQLFAFLFGASHFADAYLVAFRIPNLFRDLLAEGAMSAAFVSVFAKRERGPEQRVLAHKMMAALTLILLLLSALLFVLAPPLVDLIAGDYALVPGKSELTVGLTRLLIPFLYFTSCAALAMGILNTLGHFFIPALGAGLFNLGSVVVGGGLAWALSRGGSDPRAAVWGFGVGTLAGGFMQWGVQWPLLKKEGFRAWAGVGALFSPKKLREAFREPGLRQVAALMGPAIFGLAAVQINVLINTGFATSLAAGSVAWLNYAYRIMHFPMGVFGVALSTAALPRLSKHVKDGDMQAFRSTLDEGVRLSMILAFGSMLGFAVLGAPLVSLIYEHGRFTRADSLASGLALAAYGSGLLAFNLNKIFFSAFFAWQRVWIPTMVSALSILCNYLISGACARTWGAPGLALGTAITSTLNTAILVIAMYKMQQPFLSRKTLSVLGACLAGAVLFALAAYLNIASMLLALRDARGYLRFAAATLCVVALLGGGYLGIVAALTQEGRDIAQRFWTKLRRR